MRHADHTTQIEGTDLPDVAKAIIYGSIFNRQSLEFHQPGEGNRIVSSLRYDSLEKERPNRQHYSNFSEIFPDLEIEDILDILGYDDKYQTLKFQCDSWRSIRDASKQANNNKGDKGIVLSAETGFGKTAAFMGEVFYELSDPNFNVDTAIFVYPSRALLRDQLSTGLQLSHNINNKSSLAQPSIGIWTGPVPHKRSKVIRGESHIFEENGPRGTDYLLKIASHWDSSRQDTNFYVGANNNTNPNPLRFESSKNRYETYDSDENIVFSDHELVLHRDGIRQMAGANENPQILFTTLESLENIGLKPHYDIVANADFFIFDEIHQYTGLRGAHAANIISNIRWVRDQHDKSETDAVYIGASATVANPKEFASDLFRFTKEADHDGNHNTDLDHIKPYPIDIDEELNDKQHFYFMLTPQGENQPGVASQYIQQALMTGHSLLNDGRDTSKFLTFIDSTGQVDRLKHQINDAKNKSLYKKHIGIDEGDWKQVADIAGRDFRPDFKEPLAVHSKSQPPLPEIIEGDVINSTSLLEIGVDIGDLEFVGQYRPPRDLTTFMQRAGRAAREPTEDAHIQVFCSQFAGDQNFFYRADRFLKGDIYTPLNADNEVVRWIHNQFRSVFDGIQAIQDPDVAGGDWHDQINEKKTLQQVFVNQLGYDRFWAFLNNPKMLIDEILDEEIEASKPIYNDENSAADVQMLIDTARKEALQEFQQTSIASGAGATADIPSRNKQISSLSDDARQHLETLINLSASENLDDSEYNQRAKDKSKKLQTASEPEEIITVLEEVADLLGEAYYGLDHKNTPYSEDMYAQDTFESFQERLALVQSDGREKARKKLYKINYLDRFMESVNQYREDSKKYAAHGSLNSYKKLFRAAYFINKALQIVDDADGESVRLGTEHLDNGESEFWFVPENYFDTTGRHFSLKEVRTNEADNPIQSQESVDSILGKYLPFRPEHLSDADKLQAFIPDVEPTENGNYKIKFSEEKTYTHKGIEVPEAIELAEVTDHSGESGQDIYRVDPDSYIPLTADGDVDDNESNQFADIYSRAELDTEIDTINEKETLGKTITLESVDVKVLLEAVTLEVSPKYETESGDYRDENNEVPDKRFVSDTDFGYVLETAGVKWDLSGYLNQLFDTETGKDARDRAEKYGKFEAVNPRESALITAAHFLTIFVSDVTGIGTQMLLYGYDKKDETVHVVDKTQGGQGILDVFVDELQRDPATGLDSLYRLLHNEQILNDGFWENTTTIANDKQPWEVVYETVSIDSLRGAQDKRDEQIATIAQYVGKALNISYEPSRTRIAEEVVSTIERLHHLSENTEIDTKRFYKLKHELARARFRDAASPDEIPEHLKQEFENIFDHPDISNATVRNLLYPPDVDDCRANLQLEDTVIDADQTDVLSYALLTQLKEHIVSRKPVESKEDIHEKGRYWGRRIDDELEYFSWGENQ